MNDTLQKAFDTINNAADHACDAKIKEAQSTLKDADAVILSRAQYDRLIADKILLDALMSVGVDNWEGWDEAHELLDGVDFPIQ